MSQSDDRTKPLIINGDMYRSLPPLYQGVAKLLQQEGKVEITDKQDIDHD
jgi:hypothetical protein